MDALAGILTRPRDDSLSVRPLFVDSPVRGRPRTIRGKLMSSYLAHQCLDLDAGESATRAYRQGLKFEETDPQSSAGIRKLGARSVASRSHAPDITWRGAGGWGDLS